MTSQDKSYRQILRSSSIIGGASVINILVGLVKTKVLAVLLGPAGVGLIGLYTNIMSTTTTLAGLGISSSGVRQVAEAAGKGDEETISAARHALWRASLVLACLGTVGLWVCRSLVAEWVFKDAGYSQTVGWLSVGVFFSVLGGSQVALLNGLRRISDMAHAGIIGAVISAIIASAAVYFMGSNGILVFILSAPVASFIIAAWFLRSVPRVRVRVTWAAISTQVRCLIRLGSILMVTGLLSGVTQLLVRTRINNTLGVEEMGQFQVAWSISMLYIGFVFSAMGTDFYPRLTAVIKDKDEANKLVNEQTEIALLLAGPVLVGMLALAPMVIDLLYSHSFRPAVTMLRWQIMGDLVKIITWPMGFIILANGAGRTFFWAEMSWNISYLVIVWYGLKRFGLDIAGVGFLISYIILLLVVAVLAVKSTKFSLSQANMRIITVLTVAVVTVFIATLWWPRVAMVGGSLVAMLLLFKSLVTLSALAELQGPSSRLAAIARKIISR